MILLSQAEDLSYKYICYNNRREVGKDEKITSDLKILVCFCFLVICSIFVPSNSSADDKLPLEFQAILSFPGNGIHVGYHYNDFLFIRSTIDKT